MRDPAPHREDTRTGHAHDEPDQLREQFRQLLRYRLLIGLGVLVGLLGGGWLGLGTTDTYIAGTEVVLRAPTRDAFDGGTLDRVAMGSERRTAVSGTVARAAAVELGLPEEEADRVKEGLQVTNPPNTEVLRFSYTADDPARAARYANAFATAYLENRRAVADRMVENMVASLEEQLAPLLEERGTLDSDLAGLAEGSSAHDQALASRTALTTRINDLNDRVHALTALDTTGGRIITEAAPPASPSGPGPVLLTALGAMLGAGLGLLAAWLRLVFDPRVRSAGDVSRALRAPVLGVLPRTARPVPGRLLAGGRLAEEFRSVAFRLAYDETFAKRRRLLVVAPRGGIGTPLTTAVNLSAAFAEMGMDALLIEADLRTPSLTEQLRHADGVRPGWASSPGSGEGGWPAGRRVPIDAGESGVFDLVPGRRVRNVPRALTSPAAGRLVAHADARGAVVTVLAPAVLSYADAIALIDRVDGVLVVCDPGEVRRDDLARVRELVVGAGGTLLGAVLHSWGVGVDRWSDREDDRNPDDGLEESDGPEDADEPYAAADRGDRVPHDGRRDHRDRPVPGGRSRRREGTDAPGTRYGDPRTGPRSRDLGSETLGLRIVDPSELEERSPRP
ncbi:lipopolysaccharide biosynthesis protein [Streptomyces alkaliphilus]|uniref:Lipopolysaccharide biosynthesis protein n=1 Tax=Streptomyces alkaliphilus TaxID=1472722 RepID=A0A7W3Y1J5_9ACTN|nr:tyrosine-protein kinase domain-containing protein [Streptomyces alkaliphilus]MBB0244436.1 lipopolysaccharide biosynthesis protein [Streptomyces alkaliphilus]